MFAALLLLEPDWQNKTISLSACIAFLSIADNGILICLNESISGNSPASLTSIMLIFFDEINHLQSDQPIAATPHYQPDA